MAHLTKPEHYNIEDTNIALLGSDLEKRVREHAGDKEPAWQDAGQAPGTAVWRVEKFKIVEWPEERKGTFYSGDSYIVLHTYKKTPESNELCYDLHFWLGEETTQDEAGTAAFKTVELDDHLHGLPVQYREVQAYESPRFLSYFSHFVTLHGGISTGFHHVSSPPPLELHRLYHIKSITTITSRSTHGPHFIVRQVKPDVTSVRQAEGDVLVLDKGAQIWQFNRKGSAGKERFKASEFTRSIIEDRQKSSHFKAIDIKVFDEGGSGAGSFLAELSTDTVSIGAASESNSSSTPPALFRLSDASGTFTLTAVLTSPPRLSDLSSSDIFILDNTGDRVAPAVYTWIGKGASAEERRLGVHFAQKYLWDRKGTAPARIPVVKINEGRENEAFLMALE